MDVLQIQLVIEDRLLDHRPALASVFLGPADSQPALLPQKLEELRGKGAGRVTRYRDLLAQGVAYVVVQKLAYLLAKLFLFGGITEVHGSVSVREQVASAPAGEKRL